MKVGVCNIKSDSFEQDLLKSVINTGFAVITHHDIDIALIKDLQDKWRAFYKREEFYKNLFINGNNPNMGYKGVGTETAVGAKVADLKEFFHWRPGEELPYNVFAGTVKMFFQLESLGMQILSVLEKQTHSNYVWDCNESSNTILRVLYYPALKNLSVTDSEGAVRAAAHEDINHVTLLVAASSPGLQVQDRKGNWYDVPHEENAITVNIGDMLQLQSNGLFKSTTHRVVNPSDSESDRISMPLFIHPHAHTTLSPGYTAGKFLKERIDQIYGKK
jgi:isopenicillin N synthase-like dioxygenase